MSYLAKLWSKAEFLYMGIIILLLLATLIVLLAALELPKLARRSKPRPAVNQATRAGVSFLDLPADLRLLVYELLLTDKHGIRCTYTRATGHHRFFYRTFQAHFQYENIRLACRRIREEVTPLPLKLNPLVFHDIGCNVNGSIGAYVDFTVRSTPSERQLVHHVRVTTEWTTDVDQRYLTWLNDAAAVMRHMRIILVVERFGLREMYHYRRAAQPAKPLDLWFSDEIVLVLGGVPLFETQLCDSRPPLFPRDYLEHEPLIGELAGHGY